MTKKRTSARRECILPPVFAIDEIFGDNQIRQLFCPSRSTQVLVQPYTQKDCTGYLLTPVEIDPTPILVIPNINLPARRKKIERLIPRSFTQILALPTPDLDVNEEPLDLSSGTWVRHPGMLRKPVNYTERTAEVLESWKGAFTLAGEQSGGNLRGLRSPQVGAIHAVFAHWAVTSEAATVVMPTGTGKTEVMLALLVSERCPRLLVIVPTDALRTQIGGRFLSHGILKDIGVVSASAQYPVVGFLRNRPKEAQEVDAWFEKCNVVVTTMTVAGQCLEAAQKRMAGCCTHLFIDEAHHLGADSWGSFKEHFTGRPILQFTATPFRNDERLVEGKIIFNYPLRKALEEGYFKRIQFKPVEEYDPLEMDRSIVRKAVAQLEEDLKAGYNHILMARVETTERAKEVHALYEKYAQFNPVQVHSKILYRERERIRAQILSGETRIIVCVDMLGEGFDLPELKIAAFHDIKKSLPVTLQLTGRFTRARTDLGNPTVIANIGNADTNEELRKLYSQDADWNSLLPQSSRMVVQRQVDLMDFLAGFKKKPRGIPLQNLKPALYTTLYQTENTAWTPENFEKGIEEKTTIQHIDHFINYEKDTLVIVLARKLPVDWADIQEIYTLEWELIIVYWDREQKLLFINSSGRKGFHRKLAQAVMGKDSPLTHIKDRDVIRCFSGVTRLKVQNLGVRRIPPGNISYSMFAGPDVIPGLTAAQKSRSAASNLSGSGYEGGQRVSLGCSTAGRVWARTPKDLSSLIQGCRHIGRKILDLEIDPDDVLSGMLVPRIITERPRKMPIAIEWPELFYLEPETSYEFFLTRGGEKVTLPMFQTDLRLVDPAMTGDIRFKLVSDAEEIEREFTLSIHANGFTLTGGKNLAISHAGHIQTAKAFFDEHPPTILFHDGSFLEGNRYVLPPKGYEAYSTDKIISWDWNGVDIHKESQVDLKNPPLVKQQDSIQYHVIQEMLRNKSYTLIFDDDDTGESADVVCVTDKVRLLEIEFYHCKYAQKKNPGSSVKDLYEVCGQAQKSVQWASQPEALFDHLENREPRISRKTGQQLSRFEKGTMNDLKMLRNKSLNLPVHFKIFIVQPGVSRVKAKQGLRLLMSVTEDYLLETFNVPFGVICSQ